VAREAQLWQSIFSESEPVEGRPEVFQWRGRVLQQPQMTADGLCVIVEEATGSIVFKGLPPVAPDGAPATGPGAAGAGAAAVNEAAPPLPSFLQQDEPAPPESAARAAKGAGREEDIVRLDPEVERKLWKSILTESSPVPGRSDVFEWRGRRLKQPTMTPDGLCIIEEDATGEVVFKGAPPPPDVALQRAGESDAALGDGYTSSTLRLMKDATRVLISPAVAVVRLSTAAVTSVSGGKPAGGGAVPGAAPSAVQGSSIRSVSGTMSAMAAAWQSLKRGGGNQMKTATSATAALEGASAIGGVGREVRSDGVVWKGLDQHVADVRELAEQLRARGPGQMVTTRRPLGHSHCPRDFSYKDKTLQVDVKGLDAVIGLRQLDDGSWEMLVEPRVTMEQLVRAAAAYNLRPPVVPEFRRITVGGSIAGIAGESSSFKYGFFHDSCSGYEIVTGDGRIVTATPRCAAACACDALSCATPSPVLPSYTLTATHTRSLMTHTHAHTHTHTHTHDSNEYADLFHATPGAYGSLGIVTAATIRLVPTSGYVAMTYTHFDRVEDLVCVYLSVSMYLCLSICVYLSVSIYLCLSMCLSICVSMI